MQTNLRNLGIMSIKAAEELGYNQNVGRIVQLVRTPLLHRGGRRFESYSAHTGTPSSRGFGRNKTYMGRCGAAMGVTGDKSAATRCNRLQPASQS